MANLSQLFFLIVFGRYIKPYYAENNLTGSSFYCHNIRKDLPMMGGMVGVGFDNLRNIEMETVINASYQLCRTTEDGYFLIPDAVTVIPIKRSNLQSSVSYFEHYDNFTSTTASSINSNAEMKTSLSLLSGNFSREYETVKQRQYYDKTQTVRMQVYPILQLILKMNRLSLFCPF